MEISQEIKNYMKELGKRGGKKRKELRKPFFDLIKMSTLSAL
jgi:hypothetical protein